MHQFSDSESSDSEDGIRFKTDSTRNKQTNVVRRRCSERKYNDGQHENDDRQLDGATDSKRRHRSSSPRRSYKTSRRRSPDNSGSSSRRSRRRRSREERRHHKRRSRSKSSEKLSKRDEPKIKHCDAISSSDEEILNRKEEENIEATVTQIVEQKEISNRCQQQEVVEEEEEQTEETIEDKDVCGPALPPTMCGPELPPHLQQKPLEDNSVKCIGPTLPPHLRKQLQEAASASDVVEDEEEEGELQPEVAEEEEGDDDECYGPLPAELASKSLAHRALEERALQLKLDQLNGGQEDVNGREEWMLELPSAAAKYGLGPRQFKARAGPDLTDRSSWTDTPQTKGSKKTEVIAVDLKHQASIAQVHKRDQEQEEMIRKHKKQKKKEKEKSLLEQHQEKIKKRKKKEQDDGTNVRRPFNRDIDLKVNHFDEAQKKAIMKKAQLLDDRFSKGQSKFL